MGRRKPASFGWVREDQVELQPEPDEVVDDGPGRAERAEHRGRMEDLSDLVERLAKLPPSVRATLPLEPEAKAELEVLAGLGPTPARRRQANRVRAFVRDADRAPLDAILAGRSPKEAALQRVERQRRRLVEGGDEALTAFFAEHPDVDRQELRTAVLAARGEGAAAARASKRLFQLLKSLAPDV